MFATEKEQSRLVIKIFLGEADAILVLKDGRSGLCINRF
jgi:hypothetical protein